MRVPRPWPSADSRRPRPSRPVMHSTALPPLPPCRPFRPYRPPPPPATPALPALPLPPLFAPPTPPTPHAPLSLPPLPPYQVWTQRPPVTSKEYYEYPLKIAAADLIRAQVPPPPPCTRHIHARCPLIQAPRCHPPPPLSPRAGTPRLAWSSNPIRGYIEARLGLYLYNIGTTWVFFGALTQAPRHPV